MIIGHGDIAGAILDRLDRLYFASGVSNSVSATEPEYARERRLLLDQDRSAHLVYFSSLCVYGATTRYAQHKREMENLVERHFPAHTLIRIGNITWGSNPHTLINHLRAVHQRGEQPDLRPVYRYPIHLDEFRECLRLECGGEIDLIARRMTVAEIYQEYVLDVRESA